jgi:hypothetical protein
MTIFLVLIGMGVVFLLYVLANFWKDGHRPKTVVQEFEVKPSRGNKAEVVVITHPISISAQGGLSVIPFPIGEREQGGGTSHSTPASRMIEIPVKRFSIR